MIHAKHQYEVAKGFVDHLESKIAQGASCEEYERFKQSKIQFLDTLADLLNNPAIGKAWDTEENFPKKETVLETLNQIQKVKEGSKFLTSLLIGFLGVSYLVISALLIFSFIPR